MPRMTTTTKTGEASGTTLYRWKCVECGQRSLVWYGDENRALELGHELHQRCS